MKSWRSVPQLMQHKSPAIPVCLPQDLPGAESRLSAGEHGLRLAPPGFSAGADPRALHLDPLNPNASPCASSSHAALLRPLSAPFRLFDFDFAAPPAGGRSTELQARHFCRIVGLMHSVVWLGHPYTLHI